MTQFKQEDFFSLVDFAHRNLWKKDDDLWSPLLIMDRYLSEHPSKIEIKVPKHATLELPQFISIGKGTIIEPGVYIQGPCIIGKNCILRHGAYLRAGVILGDSCVIGHAAKVKHSILLNFAVAAHMTYVGDSILGNAVNLGAGVKCANLRFDRKSIKPGLTKLGAIIGDKVQVGCNTVFNPGTIVGKESIIYPQQLISGIIQSGQQITGKAHVS